MSVQTHVITGCTTYGCAPRIQLFGSFRLSLDRTQVPLALGVQRLLAALALREQMSRARLSAMLWPEATQRQSQANLRKVLWRLHLAVPGHRLVAGVAHDLELVPAVESDVGLLVSAMHRRLDREDGTATGGRSTPDSAALQDLVHPDAVDLLPDWDDPWLETDRERLRQLRLHLLEEWAARLADAGDYGLALELALCALQTDVLRESAHRAVINVHRAEGNVQEARRAFAVCSAVLTREVGVEPSPATAALVP